MKIALFILFVSMSPMALADYCGRNEGAMETTFGTYKFATEKLCREAYNLAKNCEEENTTKVKKEKKFKRVDCVKKLIHFISEHDSEVDRIHEDNT